MNATLANRAATPLTLHAKTAADLMVRIAGQPWLAFSGADGAFKLLAPTGSASVVLRADSEVEVRAERS